MMGEQGAVFGLSRAEGRWERVTVVLIYRDVRSWSPERGKMLLCSLVCR